jgi:4-hydroxy-2-oxoheptanedioate aldolase
MARTAGKKKSIHTLWLSTASSVAVELAKKHGYDGLCLDLEHGAFDREATDRLIAMARGMGLKAYARVAAPERIDIQQVLDSGADGIVIPHIENAEHAAEVTGFAKYPPLGDRSVGGGRTWGWGDPPAGWAARENRRVMCLPMIETAGALAAVDEILALKTCDGVFLGPFDLHMARRPREPMGCPADLKDRDRVARAANKAGKIWGMNVYSEDDMKVSKRLGLGFAALIDDVTALSATMESTIAQSRRIIG